jgi:hypothetical protein
MGYSIRKFGKFLTRWFGRLKQVVSPRHLEPINECEFQDVSLPIPSFYVSGQDTTLFPIGLGVYRGEAIIIRSFGALPPYQSSVIEKLKIHHLSDIDTDTVQNLLWLAKNLEYEKQSYLLTKDLRKQEKEKRDECPLMSRCILLPLLPSEADICNDATQHKLKVKLEGSLQPQQCLTLNSSHSCPLLYHKDNVQDSPK